MKNLASIITRGDVIQALEKIIIEKPELIKSTKFHLKYKGQFFPPKEVVRYAALEKGMKEREFSNYRLNGGPPTNRHLEKLGFEIVQFADWSITPRTEKEIRVARICWNKYGWVKPSGKEGKSKYKDSHEAKFGYGHEEWLFDIGKIIDGYHYGFLEPVRKQQDAYTGHTYIIWLYTIDERTKKRYWIGEIFNAEVISSDEAEKIKAKYIKYGWLTSMEEQIRLSGANPKGFSNYKAVDFINIKFKPNDYRLNNPYFELPKTHPINEQSRYSFGRFEESFQIEETPKAEFQFIPGTLNDSKSSDWSESSYVREETTVQISYLHKEISEKLVKVLGKIYGNENVRPEHSAGYGDNRIDIVVKTAKGLIFYEIKTYPSIRNSIRQALGQILEYAMWTEEKRAEEMIIVTQPNQEMSEVATYMNHLRKQFNIPIFYQSFDVETNLLSEKL